MEKKRLVIAFLLVLLLLVLIPFVYAGCCQGIIGCSRAFFSSECSTLAEFKTEECEELDSCEVVACCHDIPGIPKATYRATCLAMRPVPPIISTIKPFTTNPASETARAELICSSDSLPCSYVNCENENSVGCMCGATVTSEGNPFCCSRDNFVSSSFGECTSSPGCGVTDFYSISGTVSSSGGEPVVGAQIHAAGKNAITGADGSYTIEFIPDFSSGTVEAEKGSSSNITPFSVDGANVSGLDILLDVVSIIPEGVEICTNGIDDDGDQFGWDSTSEGAGDISDRCDPDCAEHFGLNIRRAVTPTYYNPSGEYYLQDDGTWRDLCSDRFDNDCNGLEDCEDAACFDKSPYCMATSCGDGVINFPNAEGIYEQCDMDYDTGLGNDSLCPGKCIPSDELRECTCLYEAVCGNSVIDEPLEDCDGIFVAADDMWNPAQYNTGSECTIDACGKPGSTRPCQCPPAQVCGNDVREAPEECDGTDKSQCGDDACNPDCTCPPQDSVCGNNLLEPGEDCDGTLSLDTHYWDVFKTRKFGCRVSTCAIPQPEDYSDTFYQEEILNIIGVDSACKCPTKCKESPPGPVLKELKQKKFERAILLNWSDECINDNVEAYNVYRCGATGPGGEGCDPEEGAIFNIINGAPISAQTQFSDTVFEGSNPGDPKYYCYRVEGVYSGMIHPPNKKKSAFDADIHCMRAGMEQCFDFHAFYPLADEFCAGHNFNIRSTCDENNTVVMVEDPEEKVNCNEPEEDFGGFMDYVCVGPYAEVHPTLAGLTKCVPKSVCDYCNDPFGIFGYSSSGGGRWDLSFEFLLGTDFGSAPERKPTEREKAQRLAYTSCPALDICYMDYSNTVANRFYSYPSDASCYDFKSYKACVEFNESFGGGNCEWEWHPLHGELGVGVCRTNITEEQECYRCHDPENEVFGRCDRDSCALFGKCYYDRANLRGEHDFYAMLAEMTEEIPFKFAQQEHDDAFYRCTHEREISCANYDSEEDCIASAGPYSITGSEVIKSNATVDVYGYMEGKKFVKTAGTNDIITPSDDFFGFGRCQWFSPPHNFNVSQFEANDTLIINTTGTYTEGVSKCVKNSDDSPPIVVFQRRQTRPDSPYSESTEIKYVSDCGATGFPDESPAPVIDSVPDCRKDIIPPVTSVPHYNNLTNPMRIAGVFEFPAVVFDDSLDYSSSSYYPKTFACVSSDGLDCYPNGSANHVGRDLGNRIAWDNVGASVSYNFSDGFQTGRHTIRFFSEDISHNLEQVKSFPVFIDADPPNVDIKFSNISYETEEDIWRTNLTMNLDILHPNPDDDQNALCNVKLFIGNVSIYPLQDIMDEFNNSWEKQYNELPDNHYTLWYRCEDDVGNIAEENLTFIIDGDKSVTNPQPRGAFNSGNQIISVETGTNAECHYYYSTEDVPEFAANITFHPIMFETMTPFKVTGSAEVTTTIHRSNVNVGHGYHRYYVKCLMMTDGKLRGNAADEIRFAVDLEPPSTSFRTSVQPYNGWYNTDIIAELKCGDPPLYGEGLDWRFGCNRTFYCIGLDCASAEGEWRQYTAPLELFDTTYISYFSTDRGGNMEPAVQNVLFQIDKQAPEISIEFLLGNISIEVLVLNELYTIRVNSSKPFISPAVSLPILAYNTEPSRFADEVRLLPTDDPSVWEGAFFYENINANRGFEGEALFTASGYDNHNVSGFGFANISIDTNPPDMPVVEPSLEQPSPDASDYAGLGYPLHYYNGTYFTNQDSLFISGYTTEFLDMIAVTSDGGSESELIYSQTPTHVDYNDIIISGFEGRHEIKILGDVTRRVNSSHFIGFDSEEINIGPKKAYGEYGMFYDVTSAAYRGGDEQYTSVMIYPVIEETLRLDREILFYDKETPSYWFGFDVPLIPFQNTSFYLKSYDDARNLIRYPAISVEQPYLVFFSDTMPPRVMGHFPGDGSTSMTTMDVYIVVKEGRDESGIFMEDINFTINNEPVSYDIEKLTYLEDIDPINDYYRIFFHVDNLEDGEYDVSIEGSDLAMNPFSEDGTSSHWVFNVDRTLPARPEFRLNGGFKGPPEDTRWYARSTDGFVVDFSNEENPVEVVDILMESAPTEGGAATCVREGESGLVERKYWTGTIYSSESLDFAPGAIHDSIDEGETKNYTINGTEYEVTALIITEWWDGRYKLKINGEVTSELGPGDIQILSDGTFLTVDTLVEPEEGPDYLSFYLGEFTGELIEKEAPEEPEDQSNIFHCTFTSPKVVTDGTWSDFGVIVRAHKTLNDGSISNDGYYGPFLFTVDDQPPNFVLSFNNRFRDNFDLEIRAFVYNEHHPLFADLEFLGEHHAPIISNNNGSAYLFIWEIEDYQKADEGEHDMTITLADFARNSKSIEMSGYLDLTAPSIENISIDISNTTINIGDKIFTSSPNVTISGIFVDDDIDAVWIIDSEGQKEMATLYLDESGTPISFNVSVRVPSPEAGTSIDDPFELPLMNYFIMVNFVNDIEIFVKDKAGHISRKDLRVITDVEGPVSPTFCIGEDWSCIPLY
ncbi:carboxypeptidase regulatory-like domain-containing protein [Candidatus Woesearchaeota archaeon]|nr:carboxypeptidase regulatory-like domain-containing protein [Candidatus Woesearchaeota archaeon]